MKNKIFALILSLAILLSLSIPVFSANVILSGDVTLDNIVSIDDVHTTIQYLYHKKSLTNSQVIQADVIRDATLGLDDAELLLKIAAGIEGGYPKEYTHWETTVEPTCSQDGVSSSYCITDGTTATHTIPKTEKHTYIHGVCTMCGKIHENAHLTVNGKSLDFGNSLEEVKAILGTPTETLTSGITTFTVYAENPAKTIIAATTTAKGLYALYTTDGAITLAGDSKSASISTATSEYEEIGDFFALFYKDTAETQKAYAAIYCTEDMGYLEINALSNISTQEKLVFYCTNALRGINDLSPLTYDVSVSTVARGHSKDMATKNYFDHTNLDGLDPGNRLDNANIAWTSFGENIIGGYMLAFDMADGWYNSPGHRANMLRAHYTHLGVGIYYSASSTYRCYGTQNFVSYY